VKLDNPILQAISYPSRSMSYNCNNPNPVLEELCWRIGWLVRRYQPRIPPIEGPNGIESRRLCPLVNYSEGHDGLLVLAHASCSARASVGVWLCIMEGEYIEDWFVDHAQYGGQEYKRQRQLLGDPEALTNIIPRVVEYIKRFDKTEAGFHEYYRWTYQEDWIEGRGMEFHNNIGNILRENRK
jgi:hypothetical protein